jgi:hypothetical protein
MVLCKSSHGASWLIVMSLHFLPLSTSHCSPWSSFCVTYKYTCHWICRVTSSPLKYIHKDPISRHMTLGPPFWVVQEVRKRDGRWKDQTLSFLGAGAGNCWPRHSLHWPHSSQALQSWLYLCRAFSIHTFCPVPYMWPYSSHHMAEGTWGA